MLLPALPPGAAAATSQQSEANLVLLEVRLGNQLLSDAVTGYEIGREVFLPLGELSRLLTLAIRVSPGEGRASGFILSEERGFSLDVPGRVIEIAGRREELDRAQFKLQPDEIYVAGSLLQRWLPVDLELDMSSLALKVRPREQLPLQARLERRKHGSMPGAPGGYVDPGYPRLATPYRLADVPFIDQTIGVSTSNTNGRRQTEAAYTAYLTTDLLGMEAALYAGRNRQDPSSGLRLTLGRNDPDAGLLGPLHARTALFGSVPLPGVPNISPSSATGNGVLVSNRPLNQPTSFDRHTLQGALPPGWDVELFYNEALVGFQQSRPDGKYSFEDMPLAYGPNEFRLVFHGPLGQLRVERQSFLLEQSAVPRGALYYDVGAHRDLAGRGRALAQFEWGVNDSINALGGWQRVPMFDGTARTYANLGLRGYWNSFIATADAARADDGGTLAQLGVKTRLGNVAVSASHAQLNKFTSDFFNQAADPVRTRDELRVEGVIAPGGTQFFPVALQVRHDRLASGVRHLDVQGRISAYRNGVALTNALRWQKVGSHELADGLFQVSRRVAGIGLSGQLQYTLSPDTALGSAAVSADYYLNDGYLLNLGLMRSFQNRELRATGALNKSLGSYGLGINGFYSNRREYGLGLQFFMAMGLEPRSSRLMLDAQPMANMGAASIRVFFDKDLNGIMDGTDEAIANAGFTVNGANYAARTGTGGIAYLPRLPTHQNTDISLDPDTLDDPQWQPRVPGVRIVPRPGKVSQVEFAVNMTGEVDGTTYLYANGARRAIGDLRLEVVDAARKVVATITSAADGYFVISGIFPGDYFLRVSPEQLKRLGLTDTGMHMITIGKDGTVLNGRDLDVRAGDGV
ncbi:MSCRAMM family protein [Telluria aromaticivorans]|uniref:Carboxypeptidase regulatory-like domain-containing protein n=1 Tax=Telluria aromaticivorans TaxID=2725995 RepID=A0A7Y2JXT9_9BURK|nr:carboxypeptidase-like regulatory domain-containing protein [Telluria aromaticivorans]NNG22997.1 carboxypeptidase regulatory-like domain-containing protein [Telluria aromaticivorans]